MTSQRDMQIQSVCYFVAGFCYFVAIIPSRKQTMKEEFIWVYGSGRGVHSGGRDQRRRLGGLHLQPHTESRKQTGSDLEPFKP